MEASRGGRCPAAPDHPASDVGRINRFQRREKFSPLIYLSEVPVKLGLLTWGRGPGGRVLGGDRHLGVARQRPSHEHPLAAVAVRHEHPGGIPAATRRADPDPVYLPPPPPWPPAATP